MVISKSVTVCKSNDDISYFRMIYDKIFGCVSSPAETDRTKHIIRRALGKKRISIYLPTVFIPIGVCGVVYQNNNFTISRLCHKYSFIFVNFPWALTLLGKGMYILMKICLVQGNMRRGYVPATYELKDKMIY